LSDTITAAVRGLCEESQSRLSLPDRPAVEAAFRAGDAVGALEGVLYDQLRPLLLADKSTRFDTHDLRKVEANFVLKRAIGATSQKWDAVVSAILACIPAGTQLRLLEDSAWPKAIDLARALVTLNVYRHEDPRVTNVAAAGERLHAKGYILLVEGGAYRFADGELERATQEISATFARDAWLQQNGPGREVRSLLDGDAHRGSCA
jgi:hypothetical protein